MRAPRNKHVDDAARMAKNARIKATSQATRARRKTMIVRTRELKIATNRLNVSQRNQLQRMFAEAKWVRNSALGAQRLDRDYLRELNGQVEVRLPGGVFETRPLQVLGGQLAQAVIDELRANLKALTALKSKGHRVGRLRFAREVTSINLAQFGRTYKIDRAKNRVKVANVAGWMKAHGLDQLAGVDEVANAKLVSRPDGYVLIVTTYTHPAHNLGRATQEFQPNTVLGIDMGVATHLTLSNGVKLDALFEETDRLKRLRRKLSRQTKGSANWRKTLHLIRRETHKITNRKNDAANKVLHEILRNEYIFLQDDNISSWKRKAGWVRGGKRLQDSILGRVKAVLMDHPRVTVIPRYTPTTATCICGVKTKHGLSKRIFACGSCRYTDDRDMHAAKNMIRFGTAYTPDRLERMVSPAEIGDHAADMDYTFLVGQQLPHH